MSMSDMMQKEIDSLKLELANVKQGIDGLLSQIDAHREQLNESLNSGLTMRTNVIFLKKQNNKVTAELNAEKEKLAALTLEYNNSLQRVTELDAALEVATTPV